MPVPRPLHVIVVGLGSAGDVHPNLGLGRALLRRGHRVLLVAPSIFRELAAQAGLDFVGIGSDEEHYAAVRDPDLWHPLKSFRVVAGRLLLPSMRPVYECIERYYEPGRTLVAAPGTAFGARIAHEKLGVPLATVHLQPILLRSAIRPGCFGIPDPLAPMPVWLRRLYFRLVDRLLIDRLIGGEVNGFRHEHGLPPVRRFFDTWIHSPQLVIGLFPEWFCPPAPDWPMKVRLAGFPLWDESDVRTAVPGLDEFLQAGESPYVFTAGSAMMHAHLFFRSAVEVCRASGRRGVLLTKFPEQLPSPLPAGVRHFDYVPFSRILPHAAAFVHHGGIGTTAQALAAGVPQLVLPLAHDQFDNAVRVRKLGAGDYVTSRKLSVDTLAQRLAAVSTSGAVAADCRRLASALSGTQPLENACDLLEQLAAGK